MPWRNFYKFCFISSSIPITKLLQKYTITISFVAYITLLQYIKIYLIFKLFLQDSSYFIFNIDIILDLRPAIKMKSFYKMQGTGNSFIIMTYHKQTSTELKELAYKLCHCSFGIGADGLLIRYPPNSLALHNQEMNKYQHMRLINKDGSDAEMCGNGLRCFGAFIHLMHGHQNKQFVVNTDTGPKCLSVEKVGEVQYQVETTMGQYNGEQIKEITAQVIQYIPQLKKKLISAHYYLFNVPHIVFNVEASQALDEKWICETGKLMQQEYNANINFIHIRKQDNQKVGLQIRTYERGAGLTLACGTGACSAYAVCFSTKHLLRQNQTEVWTDGGKLVISQKDEQIIMKGGCSIICKGQHYLDVNQEQF